MAQAKTSPKISPISRLFLSTSSKRSSAQPPDKGLTKAEADKRLAQYGPNEITEKLLGYRILDAEGEQALVAQRGPRLATSSS